MALMIPEVFSLSYRVWAICQTQKYLELPSGMQGPGFSAVWTREG